MNFPTCHRCKRILVAPEPATHDDHGRCWCARCHARSFWVAYAAVAPFTGSASVNDIDHADQREFMTIALYRVMRKYRERREFP
ncbi:MAG: hypothetical protein JWM18_5315 [Chloroflexi bacterium]|nr:hypothetical protein [Chloroflexota bacterium]